LLNAKRELLPQERAALWLLFHLCNRANQWNDYYCCPGTRALVVDTGFSERYVITLLNSLESTPGVTRWFSRVRQGKFFRYALEVEKILALESKYATSSVETHATSSVQRKTTRNSTELSAPSTELSAPSTELWRAPLKEGNSLETVKKHLPVLTNEKRNDLNPTHDIARRAAERARTQALLQEKIYGPSKGATSNGNPTTSKTA
jgi:hypothetical protein